MIMKYLWLLMCLYSAFGRRIVREHQEFWINDEPFNNVISNMNSSVDPCDDFYAYACGNYADNHPDVNYKGITSFWDYVYNRQLLKLMDNYLHQQDYQVADTHQTFVEKTRIYFKSCRTTKKRDIKKYFEEIKPADHLDWPIWQPQQWQANAEADKLFDVWPLVGRIYSYGMNNVLINQHILVKENGTFSIMLEPPFPEDGTTLPDIMMMRILLRNLGIRNTEKILEDLLELNKDLLKILTLSEDSKENLTLAYGQLDSAYPQLNLKQYFRELFRRELPASTLILIRKPKYLQQLNDNMWQTFRRRTMCNYLMLKFLVYLAKDSVSELTDLGCIKELRNKMDVSVNYLNEIHVLSNIGDIKKDISKLQRDILHQYDKIFEENHLKLNTKQIQLLRQKLHDVTLNVGNLPLNSTNMIIEDYYDNVPALDRNNYFKNHLLLLRHRFEKSLLYTGNQIHYIVADNNKGSNSSARQMLLYIHSFRLLYNSFLLGFILAHDYASAFDTTGLNFNGNGEKSDDIAAILKESNFQNSLQCLQTQLPTDSIDRRLADIVASRVAYNLFNIFCPVNASSTEQETCDPQLSPYHDISMKQFYLNIGQFFCGKSQLIFVDHDSDPQRLRQIAINSEEFAEAFHCPLGSKMNPHKKCRVY